MAGLHRDASPPKPSPNEAGSQGPLRSVRRFRWQYSVRTLLTATAVIAAALALLTALGPGFLAGAVRALVVLGWPAFCVTTAFYSRGWRQTFFLGAAVVTCLMATNPSWRAESFRGTLAIVLAYFAGAAFGGLVACGARWLAERSE